MNFFVLDVGFGFFSDLEDSIFFVDVCTLYVLKTKLLFRPFFITETPQMRYFLDRSSSNEVFPLYFGKQIFLKAKL